MKNNFSIKNLDTTGRAWNVKWRLATFWRRKSACVVSTSRSSAKCVSSRTLESNASEVSQKDTRMCQVWKGIINWLCLCVCLIGCVFVCVCLIMFLFDYICVCVSVCLCRNLFENWQLLSVFNASWLLHF